MKIKNSGLLAIALLVIFCLFSDKRVDAEFGDMIMAVNLKGMQDSGQRPVVFSHNIHRVRYKCKSCHNGLFKPDRGANEIKHQAMRTGDSCGRCHNGKLTFYSESPESCVRCHNFDSSIALNKAVIITDQTKDKKIYLALERDKWGMIFWDKEVRAGNINPQADVGSEKIEDVQKGEDIVYKAMSDSASDVIFSHKAHTFWMSCENCHNDEIFPKDYKKHVEIRMKEFSKGKWCGKCHNRMAFRFADCKRCHVLKKEKSANKLEKVIRLRLKGGIISDKMKDARKRQQVNQIRKREAIASWFRKFREETVKLKMIAPKPELKHVQTPERMIYVPGGPFLRGQDWGANQNNQPSKIIEVSAFFIDKLEVSVADYKIYAKKTKKQLPNFLRDKDLGGDNQPLYQLKWNEASGYCQFYRKRLPTEAEWEKAARGWDNRYFAWGNELPDEGDKYRANYNPGHRFEDGFRYTADVGYFKDSASPYGALDMTGNLWEWTADWYSPDYYREDAVKDPKGPPDGEEKVLRGGGFNTKTRDLLLTSRLPEKPENRSNYVGFRCARSADQGIAPE